MTKMTRLYCTYDWHVLPQW